MANRSLRKELHLTDHIFMANSRNINLLNIGLILISLALAFVIPFKLFLFSYAVLGPLHYLTEINWLHERKYWVPNVNWLLIACVLTAGVVLPHVLITFTPPIDSVLGKVGLFLSNISNGLIFFALFASAVLILVKNKTWKLILLATVVALAFFLNKQPLYNLIIGMMIPTVAHVYVFTALFMLYGARKTNDPIEFASFFILLLSPLAIIFFDVDPKRLQLTDHVKESFAVTGFHTLIAQLGKALGVMDGNSFYFYEKTEMKLQIFIAFAYLHHYLNWFGKTSIIGWHKGLNKKKLFVIIGIWLALVSAFAVSYKFGFLFALFLSFLHVILEFPLNVASLRGIIKPN